MSVLQSELRCPVCGTDAADLTAWLDIPVDVKTSRPISTGKLVWCKTCDLGMMRRLPTPEEGQESYDLSAYYTHGPSHFPQVRPGIVDRLLVKLAYLTDRGRQMDAPTLGSYQPTLQRVLDIGCGDGGFLTALVADGRRLFGIEPDPRARNAAAARGLTVFAGTAEEIPHEISEQKFDLVIMSHVLEHCADPRRGMRNVYDLVAPNGIFYCEVPNCGAIHFQTFTEISEMLDVPRHTHFFTARSLQSLLETVGFEIRASAYHGYTRHFTAAWRTWENQCHGLLSKHGGAKSTPRRTMAADLRLLARTAFASASRKYDCVGAIAGKRDTAMQI
jgi:SAM-dependent methyltransferase